MECILECLSNYLILLVPLIVIEFLVCDYYKNKHVLINIGFVIGWQAFAVLLVSILSLTTAGAINDIGKYGEHIIRLNEISLVPLKWGMQDSFGLIMNIVLFVPMGIMVPLLWKEGTKLKETVFTGFVFSLLIEISQLLNRRATDIDDLLMNTIGTLIGYGIYYLILRKCTVFQLKNHKDNWFIKNGAFVNVIIFFLFYFFAGSAILYFTWKKIYGY